jgi:UDP-N-acetylglucosamine/UDP-N-acetylgalactosamine diphosphorylase
MVRVPEDLRSRLQQHGQEHVLAFWEQLDDPQRQALLEQVRSLDMAQLSKLYALRDHPYPVPAPERIGPATVIPHDSPEAAAARKAGEQALVLGKVAVLLVAGGQGSRLGFDHPKGMYPVGPVSRKSLFQIHAEKVLATSRRYGKAVPFLIMTSAATDEETVAFFREQRFFGLPPEEVHFFRQGHMPALDLESGRLLLEEPGRLFLGPDGHGGTLTALASSGLLRRMRQRGISQVFYFQVDNPLVKIADPTFIGHHLAARAEVSSKVVAKRGPKEKMGVLASVDGRCTIVEYSDLPDRLAHETDQRGKLRMWAGNPAIHLFDVDFLERMTADQDKMPFHIARKKVPFVDSAGAQVEPRTENALKFERFIFDVLPLAQRATVVESTRESEFAPLKNAEGADSPATTEQALCDLAADWITRAGGTVSRRPDGSAAVKVEISPLYALDAEELARKLPAGTRVEADRYFA